MTDPLASAMSAQAVETNNDDDDNDFDNDNESNNNNHNNPHNHSIKHRAKEVARGFFWQTPGAILPYVASLILLLCFQSIMTNASTNEAVSIIKLQYMILVGLGGVPSAIIVFLTLKQITTETTHTEHKSHSHRSHQGALSIALHNRVYWKKLLGTGLSWALYDFIYYGTAFNLPEIIAHLFSSNYYSANDSDGDNISLLVQNSFENAIVSIMGIPGVVAAIWMMEPMGGPKPLQGWGFALIGASSIMIALYSHGGDENSINNPWGAFFVSSSLIFALNWGCNVSNFTSDIEIS